NHPLKLFHLLAQLRFAADKVLLGLIKCAGGFSWAPKHAGYGPFELSQKIIRNAMNPKIINGKLKANPIFTHCPKGRPPSSKSATSGATSGSDTSLLFSSTACSRLRC